ncbi:NAD-dependent epimerase [Rhodanobacter sp. C01]|nr:NAD-dependent epimerase [Rhodanobacter sp. C01]
MGFIGSHLVDGLLAAGHIVRCFDHPRALPIDWPHRSSPNFELFAGEFLNDEDVRAAMADCDVCFHLISTTTPAPSNANPVADIESNLAGTLRMLEHAVKAGVQKVVFASSGGTVYGIPGAATLRETDSTDPICSYGIGKLAIEKYLHLFHRLHGLDYAILRLANPFGERQRTRSSQGAVAVFLDKALKGEPIEIWGDGTTVRDYIYVEDVVSALISAAGHQGTERIFNIGMGYGLSLNQVIDAIERVCGAPVSRKYLPARAFDVPRNVLDIERASRSLNWSPQISFEQGLARFADWLRQTIESPAGNGKVFAFNTPGIREQLPVMAIAASA